MARVFLVQPFLNPIILLQQLRMVLAKCFDVADHVCLLATAAKEQFQQKFIPWRWRRRRLCKPLLEFGAPCWSERVNLAVWLAILAFGTCVDQSLCSHALEHRIDLTITFPPEEADVLHDELADVVAGHRPQRKDSEQGVADGPCAHTT